MSQRNRRKWNKERHEIKLPQEQILNLADLNGTTTKELLITKPFTKIRRMLMLLEWTAGDWSWIKFMGGTKLSNGFELVYDGVSLTPEPITNNFDLHKYWFDGMPFIDTDPTTKRIVYPGRYSFYKEIPKGLDLTGRHKFKIVSKDNLTSAGGTDPVKKFIFKGWTTNYD